MNIIVFPPLRRNSFAASSKIFFTSFTPLDVALNSLNRDCVVLATIRARVVLPTYCQSGVEGDEYTPGPAHRIIDGTRSVRMSSRSTPLGPTRSSCPTNSSRVFGRIRSARGMTSSAAVRFGFLFVGRPSCFATGLAGDIFSLDDSLGIVPHESLLRGRLRE